MSRNNIILAVIIILIILASIPLVVRFVIPRIFPSNQAVQDLLKPKNLPVDPASKGVLDVRTIYTFRGKITGTKNKPNFQIITDIKAANLPPFIITGGTIISQNLNGQILPTKASSLTKGKTVTINAEYNNKKRSWLITRITTIEKSTEKNPEPEIDQSSPSASTKK